jgi:hypothetical protein
MEEKDFEVLSEMFQSDGWEMFIDNLTELEETIMKVAPDNAVTGDQWQYCRGQVHQLRRIIGYKNFIELSWENQQAENDVDPI